MDHPTGSRHATLHGPSYRLETGFSTWTILQLETGYSTWTILQTRDRILYMDHPTAGDRLLYMDHPTNWRHDTLHGPSYTLETGCST